ncbi:non-ribosomal peptide synthetase [Metabacillus arenae]|uniref:Amino acid adenylation domain-containing protein n=1 Tax=Metabacillus arenae TaxID=2771434 RepID=A0A926NER4_9BACI|nr:non-ribosomal peptide synthetase [Metabacillus arenae]MBD1379485.1 amino acid adenylation domain-containing protein [Metabacillus arenae]
MFVKKSNYTFYPLSPNQEDIWRSHYLSPNHNHLNMFAAWKLQDDVNVQALKEAFQGITSKYETLRTNYKFENGQPVQCVHNDYPVHFEFHDLSQLNKEEFNKVLSKEAHLPFQLENGPIFKINLYLNNQNEKILLFNVHHLAIDGWSIMVMVNAVGRLYDELIKGLSPNSKAPARNYLSFVQEERQKSEAAGAENESLSYWSDRLIQGEGIHPVNLPSKNNNNHSFKGESLFFAVNEGVASELREFAKRNNITLYTLLLSVFNLLLHKYSGQNNIWIATPFARRNTKILDNVGFYANTLYIDGDFKENYSLFEFLQQISKKIQGSTKHKDISYSQLSEIMHKNRLNNEQNHANVLFNFQNLRSITKNNLGAAFLGIGGAKGKVGSLEFEVYPVNRKITQFEIEIEGVEFNKELHFRMLYDPEKYQHQVMERFSAHYEQLLKEVIKNDQKRIKEYSLLLENEVEAQLKELNHSHLLKENTKCSIVSEIEHMAESTPHAAAVMMDNRTLTYAELSEKSNQLAANLIKLGVLPEERVGLAVTRSVEMIPGILGILKAGAVYVPLDLNYPIDRLEYMIKDADISYILTDSHLELIQSKAQILRLEDMFKEDDTAVHLAVHPSQLAYILYTSGSTGRPKGVMVSHENIYYSTMARKSVYATREYCHFLLLSSISFDSSLVGIFWTLSVGGKIILSDVSEQLSVPELITTIEKHNVTHLLSVPSLVQLILKDAEPEKMNSLQAVIVAGEQFPKSLAIYQKKNFPHIVLFNEYGPTEGTVWSSYYRLEDCEHSVVPIGFPTDHAYLYILDEAMNFVPKGTTGEIFIGGQGVTRGYNNQPALTAERYIPNPFGIGDRLYRTGDLAKYNEDGSVQFLGRIDGQIKVNGFRIEVAEIEAVLEEHHHVLKSIVMVRKEDKRSAQLIAYVAASLPEFSLDELRTYLSNRLPHYMIPHQYIVLPEFPLTQNGKVDTKRLQEIKIENQVPDIIDPRNDREKELVAIFQEVLGAENISISDSFFEIGGDSILAIQISSKANEKGWLLKPKDIFDKKTIEKIAQSMEEKAAYNQRKQLNHGDEVALTPIQHWFFEQKFSYPNHWNQAIRLKVHEHLTFYMFKQAVEFLIETHDSLRLRFVENEKGWTQKFFNDKHNLAISYVDISDQQNPDERILEYTEKLQKSLNISEGPLIYAAYVNRGVHTQNENEVIIIAHHLVIDMVSWQIVLQDLDMLIDQIMAGQKLHLPFEETSYKEWADYLSSLEAGSDNESKYWSRLSDVKNSSPLIKIDKGTEASSEKIECLLGKEDTKSLLREVPKYYGTQVNELVLSAIILSLKQFSKDDNVLIDIETHGRKPLNNELDLSRTVGWFTSIHPLYFNIPDLNSPNGDLLKYVKNTMREVPNEGIGYGVKRWLKHENSIVSRDSAQYPTAMFSYNYLGKIDQAFFKSKAFTFHSYLSETVKDQHEKRLYLLDFEPYIFEDQFCLRVVYSKTSFSEMAISVLAEEIVENIRKLISFCCQTQEVGFVTTDFPEAKLDQKELEKFLSTIKHS